mgnify:CR=1 FL=1
MLKNAIGVVVSAAIVGLLYLGPAIAGILWGLFPHYVVEDLIEPERHVVYDGAWEVSDLERPGDIDGTREVIADPTLPEADEATEAVDGADQGEAEEAAGGGGEGGAGSDSLAVERPGAGRPGAPGRGGGGMARGVDLEARAAHEARRQEEARKRGELRKQSRNKCPKTFEGIARRKDGVYEVDRSLVDYHTASIKHFNELGWSKDNDEGDKQGWYVSGFGCRDALWHAGFRRRDVVLRVNGKKTNNMLQILMLYSKVKAQKHFTVEVRRKDKDLTFRYEIVR